MPKNFLSGEVSKSQFASTDQKWYQSAAQKLDGFVVSPEGGITMAPGTIYTATTKASSKVRLEVFIYSEDDIYILEIGPLYIRFYRNNAQVGAPTEVVTTYTADEIWQLDVSVQLADTLYITHVAHQRAKLVRADHDDWTLSDLAMTDGPFMDENTTDGTIAADALTGSGITLTAASGATPFTLTTDVNSIWRISHEVAEVEESGTFSSVTNGTSVYVQRDSQWRAVLIPDASWNGKVEVQKSYDNVTFFTDTTPVTSTNTDRQTLNGTADEEDLYVRLACTSFTAGTCQHYVYANSYVHNGIVKITAVASTTSATATAIKDLISTDATTKWSEGSWSDTNGYPAATFFYANRVCHAGSPTEPQQIWASAQNDFEVHRIGTKDTDAFLQPLDGTLPSPIRWVRVEDKGIIVGTLGQVLLYFPQDATLSAKPTNLFTKRTGAAHSNGYVKPVEVGGSTLLTELGGRSVKELLLSETDASMVTPDLTRFVKHLTHVDDAYGITDIAYQRRPFPILWCVRSDGVLLAMFYDRTIEAVAWSQINYTGTIESVAVEPKSTFDQVWLSGQYTIDGSDVRYVTYMHELNVRMPIDDMHFCEAGLRWQGGVESIVNITKAAECTVRVDTWPQDRDGTDLADGENVRITGVGGMTEINNLVYTVSDADSTNKTFKLKDADAVGYIDSSSFTAYTSGGTCTEVDNAFGGLTHLAGETIYIATDGIASQTVTVTAGGTITLDDYYNGVSAGLYSTREAYLLPYEGPRTLGRSKHVAGLVLGSYRTIGGRYGPMGSDGVIDPNRIRDFDWSTAVDPWEWGVPEFTGIKSITDAWGVSERQTMIIQQTEPLPMGITMVEPDIQEVS